jgi:hypothetical protein
MAFLLFCNFHNFSAQNTFFYYSLWLWS